MRCARSACEPCSGARPKASSGTRLSPATTTSVTKPWSAHRCATPCMTATASYWLCSVLHRGTQTGAARPLHRLDADTAGEKSPQDHRQRPVPHPALDTHPQPRLAHPVRRVPTVDCGLDRALSHRAPVDRNVRGDAALHWRHLQGLRMDPCRHHPGTRTVRPAQEIRQAEKNHLAAAPAQRLETDAQPLTPTTRSAAHTHPLPCTRRNGENRHPTTRHPLRTTLTLQDWATLTPRPL